MMRRRDFTLIDRDYGSMKMKRKYCVNHNFNAVRDIREKANAKAAKDTTQNHAPETNREGLDGPPYSEDDSTHKKGFSSTDNVAYSSSRNGSDCIILEGMV